MDNKTLYIIGNGFDLHHGLKTGYDNFCRYVRRYDEELYDFLERYVDLDINKKGLWCNFEIGLATFDHAAYYSDYDNTNPIEDDNFKLSHMNGVADELRELSKTMIYKLQTALHDWLNGKKYKRNKHLSLPLDINAKYLTFNYTDTLQRLYSIPDENILHIHHSIATRGNDLVFGHGTKVEQMPIYDEEGNGNYPSSAYYEAEGASKMLLACFYKDTITTIRENTEFFDNLRGIDRVIVLGHSINEIDLPYFAHLNTIIRGAKWTVSYYTDPEREKMRCALLNAGIKGDISFIKFEELAE
jgi:hypothetical protein